MKILRKILAVILALTMLLSLPCAVLAATTAQIYKVALDDRFMTISGKMIDVTVYQMKGGNGTDDNLLCLEHGQSAPSGTMSLSLTDAYKYDTDANGNKTAIYNTTTAEKLQPKASDSLPTVYNYQLEELDVYALSSIYSASAIKPSSISDWADVTYARQIAVRAYIYKQFGMGYANQLCDFTSGTPYYDASGRLVIGNIKSISAEYNPVLEFAHRLYQTAIEARSDSKLMLSKSFELNVTYLSEVNNGDGSATKVVTIYTNCTNGWQLNPAELSAYKAAGGTADVTSGAAGSTDTVTFTYPDTYTGVVNAITAYEYSTLNLFFAVPSNISNQTMIGLKKEMMSEDSVPIDFGAPPVPVVSDFPLPEIPDIEVTGIKKDKEGGFDDYVHTGRGDALLNAGFKVYLDSAYKTTFYADDNGLNGSGTMTAWDESEFSISNERYCSETGEPLSATYTLPTKTVRVDEIEPEGYLTETLSGTGDGTESYTVSYTATVKRSHTHNYDADGDFESCDLAEWEFEYRVTPDVAFTPDDSTRVQNPVTFTNEVMKGTLLIAKSKEKDFDPWGDVPNTKEPMEGARFTLRLTNGGSENSPYIHAVLLGLGDTGYDPYFNTYRVTIDGSGTVYDGSTVAKSLVTSEFGYIKILDIPWGTYTLEEIAANTPGYILETQGVTISYDGELQNRHIVDYVIRNDVKIQKEDSETGKIIPAAHIAFKIRYMGNLNTPEADRINDPNYGRYLSRPLGNGSVSYVFETDANGKITLPYYLPWGAYQLEEINAPEGYYLGAYDSTGVGSESYDTEDFYNTVAIYDASGEHIVYTTDANNLPYTIHKFEVCEMGNSVNENPVITLKAKNNSVKGKIEITKTAEKLVGFNTVITEYGTQYIPVYEMVSVDGISFEIYAKSDVALPDGIDSPLFVTTNGAAITLDTVIEDHAKWPNAQRVEEKAMADGTELSITTERYPNDLTAMATANLLTATDKPNTITFSSADTNANGDVTYDYILVVEHTPDGYGIANIVCKKVETFTEPMANTSLSTDTPVITSGTTVKSGIDDMYSDVFASGNSVNIEDALDYVTTSDVLTITHPQFYTLPYTYKDITMYRHIDNVSHGYYIAVWTDSSHTEQIWVKAMASDAYDKYILSDRNLVPAKEHNYIVPELYTFVKNDEITIEEYDGSAWNVTDSYDDSNLTIAPPAGGIDISKTLMPVTETDTASDVRTTVKSYLHVYDVAGEYFVAVYGKSGQEFIKCNAAGVPEVLYINQPTEADYLELAGYTLDTSFLPDKFVFTDGARSHLIAVKVSGDIELAEGYANGMAYSNIPDEADYPELAGYTLVDNYLLGQNSDDVNMILFADNAGNYLVYANDGTQEYMQKSTAYGEFFSGRLTHTDITLYKSPKAGEDISYAYGDFDLTLSELTTISGEGSLAQINYPTGYTAPTYELADTTTLTETSDGVSLEIETTMPTVYMEMNDGTLVGVIYSGGFAFATIKVPYGNEYPTLVYQGVEKDMTYNEAAETLSPATPKIDVLGSDGSDTRITAELHFSNKVTGEIEETIFTIAKKNEGDTVTLKMPDGRDLEISMITDPVTGETRGLVTVTCYTPTYRYLLGELVETITTGVDNDGYYTTGKAVSSELPLGEYVIREKSATATGVIITDADYEVSLEYVNQYIPLIWQSADVENERVSLKLDLQKGFETSYGSGVYAPKAGAVFGVFTNEPITAIDAATGAVDAVTAPKESLIAILTTDKDGRATEITKAPFGKYYVKELATLAGYVLNPQEFAFDFTEMTTSEPTEFEHAGKGISGEIRYLAGGQAQVYLSVLERTPAISYKVDGYDFTSDQNVYKALSNATVKAEKTDIDQKVYISTLNSNPVTIDFGDGDIITISAAERTYEATFSSSFAVTAGTDARANVTTGTAVSYETSVSRTGYNAALTSTADTNRPAIMLSNGVTAAFEVNQASGRNAAIITLPGSMAAPAIIDSTPDTTTLSAIDGKYYVDSNVLTMSTLTFSDGSTITLTKNGYDITITASGAASTISKGDVKISTSGMLSDGSVVTIISDIQKSVEYRDREYALISYLAAAGVDVRVAGDNKEAYLSFSAVPISIYVDGIAEIPSSSLTLMRQEALTAVLADGTVLDMEYALNNTLTAMLTGYVSGQITATDAAYMASHGSKDNFIDASGNVISQIAGLRSKTIDNVLLTYAENATYARSSSAANVIEVKINVVGNQESAIQNDKKPEKPTTPTTPTNPEKPKTPQMYITKTDVTDGKELPDAEITIWDAKGKVIFKGVTGSDGKVWFDKPSPGTYTFKETIAPAGYLINEEVFTFTVNADGTVTGSLGISDERKPEEMLEPELGILEFETPDDFWRNEDGNAAFTHKKPQTGLPEDNGWAMLAAIISMMILSAAACFSFVTRRSRLTAVILCMVILMPAAAYAKETTTLTHEFKSTNSQQVLDLETLPPIQKEDKTLRPKNVSYKIISKELCIEETVSYTGLEEKEVPDTFSFITDEGEEIILTLSDVSFIEVHRKAASGTVDASNREDIPESKEIAVTAAENKYTVSADLKRVETLTSNTSEPFEVAGKFWGAPDVAGYKINNTIVPNNPATPEFTGYESTILAYLGIDPVNATIKSGKWTSDYTKEDGRTVRYASFTGSRSTAEIFYRGHYTEDINGNSPGILTYNAEAVYTNDIPSGETLYTIRATVEYETEQNSILKTILILTAGIGLLALTIALVVFILGKRRKDKDAEIEEF